MKERVLAAAAVLPAWLYRTTYATLRVRLQLADGTTLAPHEYRFGREIFALCERDALALGGMVALTPFTTLVALGRDGDWASALLARLGYAPVRGSAGRGGAAALAALVRVLRTADARATIVVDGPLGPSGQAKRGIALCARRTGRPIRALGAAAQPALVFRKTWSRIFLPLPFARLVVTCDDPLTVPEAGSRDTIEEATHRLSERLTLMRRRAEEELRAWSEEEADGRERPAWHVKSGKAGSTTGAQPARLPEDRRPGEA